MIDSSIEKLAYEHAQQLAKQNIFAIPRPGTPLGLLVAELLPGASEGSVGVTEDFTQRITGMADELADLVRGYLDFTRNTVKPAIADIEAQVQAAIQNITVDPFLGINIVEQELPEPLQDTDFMSQVHSSDVATPLPRETTRFNERTTEELLALCDTGNTVFDKSIRKWLATRPEGFLQNIWQTVFMNRSLPRTSVATKNLEELLADYTAGDYSALVIYLMATRIYSSPDDDAGVDLETARNIMYSLRANAANAIVRGFDWYTSFLTSGYLVTDVSKMKRNVSVNASVYKDYMAQGGSADVLLGLMVSGAKYRTIVEITEHAEELLKEWTTYSLAMSETSQSEYELAVRTAFLDAFEASLEKVYSDAEGEELAKPGVKETAMQMFKEFVHDASRGQLTSNWIDVLWRAVVRSRYYYSSFAYVLLDSINLGVNQMGLEPEAAATIATNRYVSQFVNEMMTPV